MNLQVGASLGAGGTSGLPGLSTTDRTLAEDLWGGGGGGGGGDGGAREGLQACLGMDIVREVIPEGRGQETG